jgi:hypothetical protein
MPDEETGTFPFIVWSSSILTIALLEGGELGTPDGMETMKDLTKFFCESGLTFLEVSF